MHQEPQKLIQNLCLALSYQNEHTHGIPSHKNIIKTINSLHKDLKNHHEGKNASYIPALAEVNPQLFGIAIATVHGDIFTVGDAHSPFSIQSVSKPFTYGLALQDRGARHMLEDVGSFATGLPFNSMLAGSIRSVKLQNPLVNAGAIATVSFIHSKNKYQKWRRIARIFEKFAGHRLRCNIPVYQSEMKTNWRNRYLSHLYKLNHAFHGPVQDSLDVYTRQCALNVTTKELAIMASTLANWGTNPFTQQYVLSPKDTSHVLSIMMTAGMYDFSGQWSYRVGLPSKSGVGGGIISVVPGKFAIAVFSPPLDKHGNSAKGQSVIKALSKSWNLHILTPNK